MLEHAMRSMESLRTWKPVTQSIDKRFGTTYDDSSRVTKKGEYRSAVRKKFEYMPEIEWDDSEPEQQVVDRVIDAMKGEKDRRGGNQRFK